jgi:lauroyl/myristoyl acyltransferase
VRVRASTDVASFLAAAQKIATKTWQRNLIGLDISDAAGRQQLLEQMAEQGMLRCYLLEVGGQAIAFEVAFQINGIFYFYEGGYDVAWARFSPGQTMIYQVIQDCFEFDRPRICYFGPGMAYYKDLFANKVAEEVTLIIVKNKIANRAKIMAHYLFRSTLHAMKSAATWVAAALPDLGSCLHRLKHFLRPTLTFLRSDLQGRHLQSVSPGVRITPAAVSETAVFLVLGLVSWLWPVDRLLWPARMLRRMKGTHTNIQTQTPPAQVPPPYFSRHYAARNDRLLEAKMQILALHRPGRRWEPKIRWKGLEHLDAALSRKSGAILWDSDFVYHSLLTKMAFHQAGYDITQLARRGHGFSGSPFGIRFLNPYTIKIEDRFLADRVMINDDNTLDRLRERLEANKVIVIMVWNKARRIVELPFFTNGNILIASGPVHLAHISDAPLIPVFTIRAEDGVYDISVGPALDVPRASEVPPNSKIDYDRIIKSYVDMLEPHVLSHPDQWRGWDTVIWRHDSTSELSSG